jgi:hypothetical protein
VVGKAHPQIHSPARVVFSTVHFLPVATSFLQTNVFPSFPVLLSGLNPPHRCWQSSCAALKSLFLPLVLCRFWRQLLGSLIQARNCKGRMIVGFQITVAKKQARSLSRFVLLSALLSYCLRESAHRQVIRKAQGIASAREMPLHLLSNLSPVHSAS